MMRSVRIGCLMVLVAGCTYQPQTLALDLGPGSTLAVFPTTAPADGISLVTVTVTLQHADATPAPGMQVYLSVSDPNDSLRVSNTVLEPNTLLTADANGQVVAALASRFVGSKTITCTVDYLGHQVPVRSAVAQFTQVLHFPSFALNAANPNITAGNALSLTITSLNDQNTIATTYTGNVLLTVNDANAVLPPSVVFTPADQGTKAVSGIILKKAQMATLLAQDSNLAEVTGTTVVQVMPGSAVGYVFSLPGGTPVAGTAVDVLITAVDAYGNTDTSYSGPASVMASDSNALTPVNPVLFVHGQATLPQALTLDQSNSVWLTATDDVTPSITATQGGFSVLPGPPDRIVVTVDPNTPSIPVGGSVNFTVRVIDAYGNTASPYADTVVFSSNDPRAVLPLAYAFNPNVDAGFHTFSGVLNTVQTNTSITVADAASVKPSAGSGVVTVYATGPYLVGSWVNSPGDTVTAGLASTLTVRVLNKDGTQDSGCTGQVEFAATDPNATLPAPAALGTACQVTVAGFVFTTAKNQYVLLDNANNLAATDPPLNGTSHVMLVTAAAVNHYSLSANANVAVAGRPFVLSVAAEDQYGNVNPTWNSNATITSDDAVSMQTATAVFGAAQQGIAKVSLQLHQAGQRTIAAQDVTTSSIEGSLVLSVLPGATKTFTVTPSVTTIQAGSPFSATVASYDAYNNQTPAYAGTLVLTSNSPNAQLPPAYTFNPAADAGVHDFTGLVLTTYTAGAASAALIATDTNSSTVTGTSAGIVVTSGPAAKFDFNATRDTTVAGAQFQSQVTVADTYGNPANASGSLPVTFSTSDPNKSGVPSGTANIVNGSSSFTITLFQANPAATVTVTSAGGSSMFSGTLTMVVTAGSATALTLSNLASSAVAGTPLSFNVTATDAYGNQATGYGGTVHVAATDPCSTAFNYAYQTTDQGSHLFASSTQTLTLGRVGTHTVSVADISNAALAASQNVTVAAGAVAHFAVSGFPSGNTAPVSGSITVAAQDAYGNSAPLSGTVVISSTDPHAVISNPSQSFSGTSQTYSGITLVTAPSQSITVTSGSVSGTQAGIGVKPGSATHLTFMAPPTTAAAGASLSFTLAATDAYGNTATAYTGNVQWSANPSAGASLPAAYTYSSQDAGQHTFTGIELTVTPGATLTAQDGQLSTSAAMTITAGDPNHFSVAGFPSSTQAGQAGQVTATIQDRFNNVITGYTGAVRVTSNDSHAVLPAAYTYTSTDAGVHTFSVTLVTLTSAASITVKDTNAIAGTQAGISVTAGPVSHYALAIPSPVTAGTSQSFTVTAEDQYGNTNTSYNASFSLGSTDAAATLPTNPQFASGVATLNGLVLRTAGNPNVTATGSASMSGLQTVNVVAAAATHLAFTAQPAASQTACSPLNPAVAVAIEDAFGNTCTQNSNQITLSLATGLGLAGSLAQSATAGSATFSNVGVTMVNGSYALQASVAGLAPVVSSSFSSTGVPAAPQPGPLTVSGTGSCIDVRTSLNYLCKVTTRLTWAPTAGGSGGIATLAPGSSYGYGPVSAAGTLAFSWDSTHDLPQRALDTTLKLAITPVTNGSPTAVTTTQTLTVVNELTLAAEGPLNTTAGPVTQIVVGDFDANGAPDVAFVDNTSLYVNMNSSGSTVPISVASGAHPSALAVGDLNSDGKDDLLLCAPGGSAAVYAMYGSATGLPVSSGATPIAGMTTCVEVFALDVNHDGTLDVVADAASLLQFATGPAYRAVGIQPLAGFTPVLGGVTADWNADGYADLVLMQANSANALYLAGNSGSFANGVSVPSGAGAIRALAAGDVNHDGQVDLAAATSSGLVLFTATTTSWTAGAVQSTTLGAPLTLADLNGDAYPDLVAGNGANLAVYFGNAHASYGAAAFTLSTQGGSGIGALTHADMNRDGAIDVVVGNVADSGEIYLNTTRRACAWNMQALHALPLLKSASSVAAGDFNEDGKPDVAVANQNGSNSAVLIALGDGARGFTGTPSVIAVGASAGTIAVADFDGDGHLDIAVPAAGHIVLIYGDGAGGERSSLIIYTSAAAQQAAAADMNNDGATDLVLVESGKVVEVRLGPDFTTSMSLTLSAQANGVALGDLNGDGYIDLVPWSQSSGLVFNVRNNSGTSLTAVGAPFSSALAPVAVTVAPLISGSSQPWVAVADAGNSALYLMGVSTGAFVLPATYFPAGCTPVGLTSADFDLQSGPDLALSCQNPNQGLAVIYNNGSAGVRAIVNVPTSRNPSMSTVADFNGDGAPDIATLNDSSSVLTLATNALPSGVATFYGALYIPLSAASPAPAAVCLADLNRDGAQDFATNDSATLDVFAGTGTGSYNGPDYVSGSDVGSSIVSADVDGNGTPDVLAAGASAVTFFLNTTAAGQSLSLSSAQAVSFHGTPRTIALGDVNHDGTQDMAVASNTSEGLEVSTYSAGAFASPASLVPAGGAAQGVALGDVNHDGWLDALVTNGGANTVSLIINQAGSWASPQSIPCAGCAGPWGVALGDLDHDGTLDGVVVLSATSTTQIVIAPALAGFSETIDLGVVPGSQTGGQVVLADVNRDGYLDIVVPELVDFGVAVLLNQRGSGFAAPVFFTEGGGSRQVGVADVNNDGVVDITVLNDADRLLGIWLGD